MAFKDPARQKEYAKQHHAEWYKANKERLVRRMAERRAELRKWLDDYKATLSCERCPESHPACIDFHHVDPATKSFAVGDMPTLGHSIARMLEEIAKCMVLCANCHRKAHWSAANE